MSAPGFDPGRRLVDMTIGELLEAVRGEMRTVAREEAEQERQSQTGRRYVYGLDGLASLFGCGRTTAWRLKASGKIDDAVTQVGQLLIIDAELALALAGGKTAPKAQA